MNWWTQVGEAREALKTEAHEVPTLPSYPFPSDQSQAALVWDLCSSGDLIVVESEDGTRSIVVL